MKGRLYNKLTEYADSGAYAFHMPGHKRKTAEMEFVNPYKIDITEIDGFDNLHNPTGILKEIMESAAEKYKTKNTFFLVNGSTSGLLSAISAAAPRGSEILIARNCHKAVYNAALLRGLKLHYVIPKENYKLGINGEISKKNVEKVLKDNKNIKAVVITSPTFEGVVSDIKSIAELVHSMGIPLIVDEAHGAHFSYNKIFPVSAVECGADIVIHSTHKTLPAMTQTALLHYNSDIIDIKKVKNFLGIYQSSSPSYVLMSSIDNCVSDRKNLEERFEKYISNLKSFRKKLSGLEHIILAENNDANEIFFEYDISKIVLSVKESSINGKELYDILLNKYNIQLEMAAGEYVVAMTTVMDEEKDFDHFYDALKNIDEIIEKSDKIEIENELIYPVSKYTIEEAFEKDNRRISLKNAEKEIAAEYLYVYPPGIPILVPGEVITENLLDLIDKYEQMGLNLEGLSDISNKTILVTK